MPEGDTIHRAARTLHAALAGKKVVRFETAYAHLARVDEDAPIAGRTVEKVEALGKHLLIRFSGGLVLRTHMRMNGSWHVYRPGERWRARRSSMRIVVAVEDWVGVAFDVPVAELLTEAEAARHEDLRRLGPDLLGETFDAAEAARRIRARTAEAIGDVLLDQRVLAGIGNVYKSEILFMAGVSPFRLVASVSDAELAAILELSRKLLLANVAPGKGDGITTYFGGRRTTGRTDPSHALWVYGRSGEPCRRCGEPVMFRKQGADARVTYWCERCQPA